MKTLIKPIAASILVYLASDVLWTYLLTPIGLGDLHALLAMFGGMVVGGFLARQGFLWTAISIAVFFSLLSYGAVAMMRDQNILELVVEQSLLISLGSFAGAVGGATVGMWLGRQHAPRA